VKKRSSHPGSPKCIEKRGFFERFGRQTVISGVK
jgi:hypothetical protein